MIVLRRTVPFECETGPANETKTVGPELAARSKLDISSRVPFAIETFGLLTTLAGSFDEFRT